MNNSWRQPPVEELQRQFVPLQAVKQQRNRLLGAPLQALPQQHGSRAWPYQQQNPPLPTESTSTTKVTKHSHVADFVWITDGKTNLSRDLLMMCGSSFLFFWHQLEVKDRNQMMFPWSSSP